MQKKKLLAKDIEKLENTSLSALVAYAEHEFGIGDATGSNGCCTSGSLCVCCVTVDVFEIRYAAYQDGLLTI